MASFTFGANQSWPAGTVVTVWEDKGQRPSSENGPPGSSVASGTVAANSTLTVTGLTEGRNYWAVAQVGGTYFWKHFYVPTDPDFTNPEILAHVGDLTPHPAAEVAHGRFNVRDYGAVGGDSAADTAGILEAVAAAKLNGSAGAVYSPVIFPRTPGVAGYVFDPSVAGPIKPDEFMYFQGDARYATSILLKAGATQGIIEGGTASGDELRFFCRDMAFRTEDKASHGANQPSLVRLSVYYSSFINCEFDAGPGHGLELGVASTVVADRSVLVDCLFVANTLYGLYLNQFPFVKVVGGGAEQNAIGVYAKDAAAKGISGGSIDGFNFEDNTQYSYYSEGVSGMRVKNGYIFNAPVGLDSNSHNNVVQHNTVLDAPIYDGGRSNIVTPNHGQQRRPQDGRPFSVFFPAGIAWDPDMSNRNTGFFTATGGAGMNRLDNASNLRMQDRDGRLPLQITGAGTKGAYQLAQNVVAGETYLLEVEWWSDVSGGSVARAQVLVVDNGGATPTLYDSGVLTRPDGPSGVVTEAHYNRHRTVFQVPAAGFTGPHVRIQLQSPDNGALFWGITRFIPVTALNGGMEGAYAAGIAPGWANKAGAGTPSEEGTIVRTGVKSQKCVVSAGQSLTLGQTVGSDTTLGLGQEFYLLRGEVYVANGDIGQAAIGYGNLDLNNSGDYQVRVGARRSAMWETVSAVFRPSSRANVLFGLKSGSAATAYFDDIVFMPLKDAVGPLVARTPEITLSAAAVDHMVIAPVGLTRRLRRVSVVYTVASDANAGVAIRVGTYASLTYYNSGGAYTSEINKAQGSVVEIPIGRSDIRPGVPVNVQCAGGKTGVGKVVVVLEYE